MKLRITALALILVLLSAFVVAPKSAGAASAPRTAAITQTVTGTTSTGAAFTGTFTLTSFQVVNGVLNAVGNITNATVGGQAIPDITNVMLPINLQQATGTCQILTLHVGAIDLNLLGLMVHLNPIDLTINAQAGPGNLLGNLLCSVAHLLDNGNVAGLANLLNRLNAILAGL